MDVQLKRVYLAAEASDGVRVLVDRLWPRGIKRSDADLDLWLKDAAPSPDLRKAWHADAQGHDADHFKAFADDYRSELAESPASEAVDELVDLAQGSKRVTLLFGAKEEEVNHAVVLREVVLERAKGS